MSRYLVSISDNVDETEISFANIINATASKGYRYIQQHDLCANGGALSYSTTLPSQGVSSHATLTSPAATSSEGDIQFLKFIVWGIMGSSLAILGFLGNTLSMVVLHHPQMRSSTSYYLISLAVYDNFILLGMMIYFCLVSLAPYVSFLTNYQSFSSSTIVFGYPLSLTAQMGSIYTCMAFTIERYIAVCWPLHAANTCTKSRTARIIILIFLWSFSYNVPRFFHYETVYADEAALSVQNSVTNDFKMTNNSFMDVRCDKKYNTTPCSPQKAFTQTINNVTDFHSCIENITGLTGSTQLSAGSSNPCAHRATTYKVTEFGSSYTFKHAYLIYSQLFFMFLLPFLVILIMNVGLIQAVRGSKHVQQSMCASARKEHNLTVMLIAVIVVFLICQFPTIVDNILVAVMAEEGQHDNYSYMCFWITCTLMVEINAASNFILYCFFGKKFRMMLLATLGLRDKYNQVTFRSTIWRYRTNGSRTDDIEMSAV